jgi:type II secretory pathway component PulF
VNIIYSFTYDLDSEIKDGALAAISHADAINKIKKTGINPKKVFIDPYLTIKNIISDRYDHKDLIRLYKTIGNRILMGKSLVDGLESADEFIFDKKLKFTVLSMANRLKTGDKIYESMLKSGFGKLDAMVIRSSESSGNQGEAFIRLAEEIRRKNEISEGIKKIFIMPGITMFIIYIGCFLAPFFFGVATEKQLKGLDLKTADFDTYFKVAHFSNDYAIIYFLLAAMPIVGLFVAFKKGWIGNLLDKWKLWKSVSVKSDMANTWVAFAQLWDAGVTPSSCADLVQEACERKDSKEAFIKLKRGLLSGKNLPEATFQSGFIPLVKKGVKAAEEGSSLSVPEGIKSMCDELSADVMAMVEIMKAWFTVISLFLGGMGVLLFIYVALGPVYMTAIKSL